MSPVGNSNAPFRYELTCVWNYAGYQEVTRLAIWFTFPTKTGTPSMIRLACPETDICRQPHTCADTKHSTEGANKQLSDRPIAYLWEPWTVTVRSLHSLCTLARKIAICTLRFVMFQFVQLPNINAYSNLGRKCLSKGKTTPSGSPGRNTNILPKVSHTIRL